jgi:hypothetical protein
MKLEAVCDEAINEICGDDFFWSFESCIHMCSTVKWKNELFGP